MHSYGGSHIEVDFAFAPKYQNGCAAFELFGTAFAYLATLYRFVKGRLLQSILEIRSFLGLRFGPASALRLELERTGNM
jgi:hypothetical protein